MKRAQRCAVQEGLVAIDTDRKSKAFAAVVIKVYFHRV